MQLKTGKKEHGHQPRPQTTKTMVASGTTSFCCEHSARRRAMGVWWVGSELKHCKSDKWRDTLTGRAVAGGVYALSCWATDPKTK